MSEYFLADLRWQVVGQVHPQALHLIFMLDFLTVCEISFQALAPKMVGRDQLFLQHVAGQFHPQTLQLFNGFFRLFQGFIPGYGNTIKILYLREGIKNCFIFLEKT